MFMQARMKVYQQQQHRLQHQGSQKGVAAAGGKAAAAGPGLPEPIIAHIARQLVAGLQYLHKELKVRLRLVPIGVLSKGTQASGLDSAWSFHRGLSRRCQS